MKCPNCGRLDFDSSEVCPRCGEPLPPGSGEFSGETAEKPAPATVAPPPAPKKEESPGPLFAPPGAPLVEPKHEKAAKPKTSEPAQKPTPVFPPPEEKKIPAPLVPPERSAAPAPPIVAPPRTDPKPPEKEKPKPLLEKPKVTQSAPPAQKPAPSAPPQRSRPIETIYPPQDYVEKITSRPPPQSTKTPPPARPVIRDKPKTTPEPYQQDSATFSSELSTDWIEKYARVHVAKTPNLATVGMRGWGFVIDWLLLTAMGVVILLVGRLVITIIDGRPHPPMEMLGILAVPVGGVWMVVAFLYFTVFTAASGQTPGKLAMDLRVVGDDGRPPPLAKAALRSFIYILSIFPLGLGLWWALFNEHRRGWHDMAAKTSVQSVFHRKTI